MIKESRKRNSTEEKANFVLYCMSRSDSVKAFCRDHQISTASFYRWRAIFIDGGISAFKKKKTNIKPSPDLEECCNKKIEHIFKVIDSYSNCLSARYNMGNRIPTRIKLEIIEIIEISPIPKKTALNLLKLSRSTYYRWLKRFQQTGNVKNLKTWPQHTRLSERNDIKDHLFKVLHTPPLELGFNRTTWKMDDLQQTLKKSGVSIGKSNIRKIIRNTGYRWLKAKKVLTSNDPDYRNKLDHIQYILNNLGCKEGFFSIDEYGPFAVKHRQGRKLVAPGKTFTVPQWEKSKGVLIITAALELSTNQITHFYSKKKDTEEMIKLLELLLKKHNHLDRIFLSWDAASWHISKKLQERIKEINLMANNNNSPQVELAPLPAGAQFLNVIEAVFSGMARAVIHNSNYLSKMEAKSAIDSYIDERNHHFKNNPKRAGRKIWGDEKISIQFSESHNCKNPRYR